jgi:PAS domain S-box-containing protein
MSGDATVAESLPPMAAAGVDDLDFRMFADYLPTLCWLANGDGYIVWYNRRWHEYCGTKPEQMEGWGWQSVHHPDVLPEVMDRWQGSIATGEPFEMTFPLRGADGVFRPFLTRVQPIRDASGRVARWFGVNTDISAQVGIEEELTRKTEHLEVLNRTGETIAADLNLDRLVYTVTEAGVTLTGAQFGAFFYNVMDEAGEAFMLYALAGADRSQFDQFGMPRATAVFKPTFDGEGVIRSDDILKDARYGKSGPHFGIPKAHLPVCSYLAAPVISRSGEVIGGLFFGHAEAAVFTEAHERLILGLAGQAAVAIDNARLFQSAENELGQRRAVEAELKALNAELEERVAAEVAERTKAEEALRQSQKMEAVGQLTGGIAHDFNNLLAGISGSLELLEQRLAEGRLSGLERYISAAQGSARRAASLTQRLLAFARRQTLDPRAVDANKMIAGMADLFQRTVGPSVGIKTVQAGGLWATKVDPSQLENALLNLCINARDAMAPNGGVITIETSTTRLDDREAKERELRPGQYVSICVSDTGSGMAPDVVAKAFDPFFTTKPIGQGTGLGLSMIYGFVRQSDGHVSVDSEIGKGTTMCLYLPRDLSDISDDIAITDGPADLGAGQTVLVIDDEPVILMLVAEFLGESGYHVIEATDGPGGLKVLQSTDRVDLLITDVGLPGGLNGRQVADAARETRPDLKVLFITGFAENAAVGAGQLPYGMSVITKPFTMTALANKVSELIESSPKSLEK